MNYPNIGAVTICAGLIASAPSWAADSSRNQASDPAIEEIIVSASVLSRSADNLTQPVSILDREDLLTKATSSIGETLANELGVSSTYFGPVAGRPIIRGQSGPRISVLQAGVSTLDVADLSPDHAVPLEPLLAERIEIIRGPATLLYGSAAAGGVVNIVDNRVPESLVEEGVSGAVELRGDTATEERAIAGRIDGSSGNIAWHLDGVSRESEDIDINGFATADEDERPDEEESGTLLNSFGDSFGFSGGVSAIGERGFIGVSVSRFENDYGLPGPEEEEEEEGEEGEEEGPPISDGPFIELEQTRYDLRGEYEFDNFIEKARLRIGYNDYEHSEIEPSGEVATLFENDAFEGRLELSHDAIASWKGAFGVQYNNREFSAVGEEAFIPPTDTTSVGLFLFEEREFEWGLIDFGMRLDFLEHEPDAASGFEDYDETAFSAAIGGRFNLTEGLVMTANYSRSERNLAAEELYSNGAHLATALFEVGLVAAGLDAEIEVSNNIDVSLNYQSDYVSWKIGGFFNNIDDYTFREGSPLLEDGLPLAIYQQQDAEFYGYEAEIRFSPTGADSPWGVRLFSDLVRARGEGNDLPRVPPTRVGGELTYADSRFSGGVSAIYHAEQDDISTFATDDFTMLNVNVAFHLGQSNGFAWDLFAKGTNLLDEDARRSTSFRAAFVPLPGASFHLGMRARFN